MNKKSDILQHYTLENLLDVYLAIFSILNLKKVIFVIKFKPRPFINK